MIPINWKNNDTDDGTSSTRNVSNDNIIDSIIDSITNSIAPINDSSIIVNKNSNDYNNKNDIANPNSNNDVDDANVSNKKKKRSRNDDDIQHIITSSSSSSSSGILYENINIDKIFTDPNTTVVFPRLFNLRSIQYKDGVDLTGLSPQKLGIVNVKTIHHISKVVEARGDYYRVRVCRTCSKNLTLIELGSYSDLESALLANDMYEMQQQKYDQLCLLDKIDNNEYLEKLTARRRGVSEEQSLITVLQQRMNKIKEKNDKMKTSVVVSDSICQPIQRPSNDAVIDKPTFKQLLELNSLEYFTPYLLWIACDSVLPSTSTMLSAYVTKITEKNGNAKVLTNKGNATSSRKEKDSIAANGFSRNLLFLIISSLYPGKINECKDTIERLYDMNPEIYESSFEYMNGVKNALLEMSTFENTVVHQIDSEPDILCTQYFPSCLNLFKRTFDICVYADYKLRLLSWDNAEFADNEVFIQGIQNQIEVRVTVLLGMLTKLESQKGNQSGLKVEILKSLLNKAVFAMLYACLINSTVSLIASKLTINFFKLKMALELCNKFLPHLLPTVQNTVLLQDFFQRQSDLLVFVLIDAVVKVDINSNLLTNLGLEGLNGAQSDDDEEKKKLASSLACEMLKVSVKCLNDLQSTGATDTVNYLELSVKTFSTLFGTYVAFTLHNYSNNFSENLGLTFAQVITSLNDSLLKFEKYMNYCDCCVLSTHTMISLNNLIENCYLCKKFPETLQNTDAIASIAKNVLASSGSRFVLSQLLIKSIDNKTHLLENDQTKSQKC